MVYAVTILESTGSSVPTAAVTIQEVSPMKPFLQLYEAPWGILNGLPVG
jgi:hypothetical protein